MVKQLWRDCTDWPEPLLFACVISSFFIWTGSFKQMKYENFKVHVSGFQRSPCQIALWPITFILECIKNLTLTSNINVKECFPYIKVY